MRFICEAELEFSSEIERHRQEIAKALSDAEANLLRKGVPKGKESGASKIVEWGAKGKNLRLLIESGRHARAHDALLRVRNFLNQQLGAKLKLGVRGVKLLRLEAREIELKSEPVAPVKISFFVDELKISGKSADVKISNKLSIDAIEKGAVDRIVELVAEKAERQGYAGKEEFKKEIWRGGEKKMSFGSEPSEEMEKRDWIRRTGAKGQFVYGKNFTALANALKEIMKEKLYEPLGFSEMVFPKFEPWSVPARSGHCKSIYPDAYYVMVPKLSDKKEFEDVMDYFKITGEVNKELLVGKLQSVGILSYAQCPPFWQYLEGKVVKSESLPLKIYDWSGPTYRNEAGGTEGIARIEEFHRIETLFVGTPEHVREIAREVEEKLTEIFDKVLELEIRKCSVTPWWMAQEGEREVAERSGEGVGTVDFEGYLPYKGSRERSEWLEFQNVSVIGDKYPKAFSVKAQRGELWSGCGGASVQRLACVLLAQKGFEEKNWPAEIRKRAKVVDEVSFA